MSSAGWEELPLERVAEIHDNLREPVNAGERAVRHGPYPYYGATGQVGWIDNFRQDGEYVLLGEDGAPFLDITKDKAYLVSGKCWVNNHAHVLRGKEGVCINKFLLHALNAVNYRGYANGTTRLKLTQAAMRKLPIKLPSVDLQTQVVSKIEELFSDLDAGVAALKRAQANLKRYRAAVLKAAVEGRLTAEWRAQRKAKGIATEPAAKLLERILAERRKKWEAAQLKKYAEAGKAPPKGWQGKYPEPAGMEKNALPELPDGWLWCSLDQASWLVKNGLSQKPSVEPKGFPILRINAVRPMSVDESEVRYLDISEKQAADYVLEDGDLLFTRYNGSVDLLGVAGLVRGITQKLLHPDKLIRVKAVLSSDMPKYLELACNCGVSRKHIVSKARTTAGQTGVSGTDIKAIPIPICSLLEQTEIVSQVEAKLSNIAQAETEIKRSLERAARLRQAILKRVFEGRLV